MNNITTPLPRPLCPRGVHFMMIRQVLLCRSSLLTSQGRRLLSSTAASDKKIYELRTYAAQPSRFVEFLKLTEQRIHLRTSHSKLVGYWTTELGGINEVVHLWEYGMHV